MNVDFRWHYDYNIYICYVYIYIYEYEFAPAARTLGHAQRVIKWIFVQKIINSPFFMRK